MKYLPVVVIVASVALYHACQRSFSKGSSPWSILAAAYLIAFGLTVLAATPWKSVPFQFSLTTFLLGLACIGIEAGYLMAYQSGWNMGELFTMTTVGSAAMVLLVGHFAYGEVVSLASIAGFGLAVSGVTLMKWASS